MNRFFGFSIIGLIQVIQVASTLGGDTDSAHLDLVRNSSSNAWHLTLQTVLPHQIYTLSESDRLSPDAWRDIKIVQTGTGSLILAQITPPWSASACFYTARESANEDSDGDLLCNRAEFEAGSDPMRIDTDGDQFTDYEEVSRTQTHPGVSGDGIELAEDTRRLILAKWALVFAASPSFTNRPGSRADWADLELCVRQLSGVFYDIRE